MSFSALTLSFSRAFGAAAFALAVLASGGAQAQTASVTLSASTTSSTFGDPVQFTAVVSSNGGPALDGQVHFHDGSVGNPSNQFDAIDVVSVGVGNPIAAGTRFACAITGGGAVKCWGSNSAGELAENDTSSYVSDTPLPAQVLTSGVTAIAAGDSHACAVKDSGIYCWGDNGFGKLGRDPGTVSSSGMPAGIDAVSNSMIGVAVGTDHTCALSQFGTVSCWGANSVGQLGNGTTDSNSHPTPAQVSGLSDVKAIAALDTSTCALLNSGAVKCWGANYLGQIGNGVSGSPILTPTAVTGLVNVVSITAGNVHVCAVTNTGAVQCWGWNGSGQLGDNFAESFSGTPVGVSGLGSGSGVVGIASGSQASHTCALLSDGSSRCWGMNSTGQIGDSTTSSSRAEPVTSTSSVSQMSLGAGFSCAVLLDGSVTCWGDNYLGQLGDGNSPTGTTSASTSVTGFGAGTALIYGIARANKSNLAVGDHTIMAQYIDNTEVDHFDSAASNGVVVSVGQAASSVGVQTSGSPSTYGSQVTFTATVTPSTATGTVTLLIDGVGQIVPVSSGTATVQTSALGGGSHTITAIYNGDGSYFGSTSSDLTQTVTPQPTMTGLSSSGSPSTFGQPVTFTAAVGVGATGPVAFMEGVATLGTGNLSADGTASFSTGALSVGDHTITAAYAGDSNYRSSTSVGITQTVGKDATTTSVGSAPNPSKFGQSVTFTATVTDGATGTVEFKEGSTTLGSGNISGNTVSFITSALSVGDHTITAAYAGDSNYESSTSSGITQTVNKGGTTLAVSSLPAVAKPGQSVTLKATISVTAPAAGTPTGTVTFKEGTTVLGTNTLSGGSTSLTVPGLKVGSHTVTATYPGSTTLAASAGSASVTIDPKVGPEFRVNTTTANSQQLPAVARLTSNAFVVVWASNAQDGAGYGVYGQRYNANGVKLGAEFRVNTTTAMDQTQPSIAGLKDGGFVVAWQSNGEDGSGFGIYAQRYTAAGVKSGSEFKVNTTTANQQSLPSVTALTAGGFVVAWTSNGQDGSGLGVYAQRYDATAKAAGTEFKVNKTTTGDQSNPAVAGLTGGGFVVTWQGPDPSGLGVFAQRYDAGGKIQGSEFKVNTVTLHDQSLPSIAALDNGGFIIAWQSSLQDSSGLGVYLQRFAAAGARAGGETRVNTTTANDQGTPAVAAFSDGGFVVTWASKGQDGSGQGVYAQAFTDAGAAVNVEFPVNTTTVKDQYQPVAAAFASGNFIVVWTSVGQDGSLEGVYSQRFLLPGTH